MTTKNIDPLAGIPTATASPKRTPKPAATPATAPTGGNVINLGQAQAARKRKRLTGDEYKAARDFARQATGYDSTSPIWGKRLPVVLMEIEALLEDANTNLENLHDPVTAGEQLRLALSLNRELQKRVATGQLIGAQN